MDIETLRKPISDILDEANLSTITAKKIREQLEITLKTNLTSQRKEVDKLIMDILSKKQNKSGSEEEESEEEEVKPAKRGRGRPSAKNGGSDSGSEDEKKKKPAAKAAGKKGAGTGFTRTYTLSKELAAVMGEPALARHEVVKRMWKLIKEKNLYDPKNKQFAICNDELLPVFGVKRFRTFGMMKYLKTHFKD